MRKELSRFVVVLWSVIILAVAGLSFVLLRPAQQQSQLKTATGQPPSTSAPTAIPSATNTPLPPPSTPTSSPSPTVSPTETPAIKPLVIGYSVTGRPLEVYQFGDGPVEKMIVAGIHGGYEWNTIALADELIEYLETHPEVIPPDHTLFLLRAFNPDGFERSRGFGGRANENNVDLNRNFPSNWQSDWPRAGCWDYIPIEGGSSPASEPETKALISFIESHDLQAFISYHSAALGIFAGGQPADPGSISLAETIASVSDYPYPPIDAGCVFTGQLVDWVSDQGIPGIDIELTNHQDTDFEINLAILSVFLDWKPTQELTP